MVDNTAPPTQSGEPSQPTNVGDATETRDFNTVTGTTATTAQAIGSPTLSPPPPSAPEPGGASYTAGPAQGAPLGFPHIRVLEDVVRPTEGRVFAGVGRALANRLGIDPLLARIVLVVLAFFGGAGVLIYALGWLLFPEQRTGMSVLERSFGPRRDGDSSTLLLSLGLAFAALAAASSVIGASFEGLVLLAIIALVVALILRRPEASPPQGLAGYPTPGWQTQPGSPTAAVPDFSQTTTYSASSPGATMTTTTSPPAAPPESQPTTWGYSEPPPPWGTPTDSPLPMPRKHPKSVLFGLTMSLALVAVGILGVSDVNGSDVTNAAYVGVPLAVVGLGLLVGTWWGRSRGLIAVGIILALVLPPVAIASEWDFADEGTAVRVTPLTTAEITGLNTSHGAGDVVYDLSNINFAGRDVDLAIEMGVGELLVIVPDDVVVIIDAEVGLGEIQGLESTTAGPGSTLTERVPPLVNPDSITDAGTVRLDLQLGLGSMEVRREAA